MLNGQTYHSYTVTEYAYYMQEAMLYAKDSEQSMWQMCLRQQCNI